jgi:hypothetical protein
MVDEISIEESPIREGKIQVINNRRKSDPFNEHFLSLFLFFYYTSIVLTKN